MGLRRGVNIALVASFAMLGPLSPSGVSAAEPNPNELPEFAPPRRPKPDPSAAIRIDVLTPLIDGLLAVAVETRLARQVTVDIVPEVGIWHGVLGTAPAGFGEIEREGRGLGHLTGGQLDIGFWPGRRPFEKTVYRFGYAARSFRYQSVYSGQVIDEVDQVQHLLLFGGGF